MDGWQRRDSEQTPNTREYLGRRAKLPVLHCKRLLVLVSSYPEALRCINDALNYDKAGSFGVVISALSACDVELFGW